MGQEFKAFDRVLVRINSEYKWQVDFFSHYEEDDDCIFPRYICIGNSWHKCIPYEGNEHLLGTTDMPELEGKTYKERQSKCGIKVGDTVRVMRREGK
jgi:hypothetical protein